MSMFKQDLEYIDRIRNKCYWCNIFRYNLFNIDQRKIVYLCLALRMPICNWSARPVDNNKQNSLIIPSLSYFSSLQLDLYFHQVTAISDHLSIQNIQIMRILFVQHHLNV